MNSTQNNSPSGTSRDVAPKRKSRARQNRTDLETTRDAIAVATAWNVFNENFGSFADEQSTL